MGFAVVQWEEEESISVIGEKDIIGEAEEGKLVTVMTRNAKGRANIYQAVILKLFGK
jgi:RecB family endonuclease NucS